MLAQASAGYIYPIRYDIDITLSYRGRLDVSIAESAPICANLDRQSNRGRFVIPPPVCALGSPPPFSRALADDRRYPTALG